MDETLEPDKVYTPEEWSERQDLQSFSEMCDTSKWPATLPGNPA